MGTIKLYNREDSEISTIDRRLPMSLDGDTTDKDGDHCLFINEQLGDSVEPPNMPSLEELWERAYTNPDPRFKGKERER